MGRSDYCDWRSPEFSAAQSRNSPQKTLSQKLKVTTLLPKFFALFAISSAFCVPFLALQLPLEPARDSGQSITGAYEGWYQNPDGSFSFLVGYYNRNQKEALDIPVGPNNRIEPGGPDQGQPTYFLPRRQWGVFTITVPKDFGDKKLTWTLTANGQTTSVPLSLN